MKKGEKNGISAQKIAKRKKYIPIKACSWSKYESNTISRYENLEREADYETLIKFADYFGVSPDYLLGRAEEK